MASFFDQVKSQYSQVSGAVKDAVAGARGAPNSNHLRLERYGYAAMDSFGDDVSAYAAAGHLRKPLPLTFSILGARISPVQVVSAGIFAVAVGVLVRRWIAGRQRKQRSRHSRRTRSESPESSESSSKRYDEHRAPGGSRSKHRR